MFHLEGQGAHEGAFIFRTGSYNSVSIELHSDNPDFKPITFSDGQHLEIWGVVVGLVRRYQ